MGNPARTTGSSASACSTKSCTARVGGRQLQPPVVGQPLLHRQPRARRPQDFDTATITAPTNPDLPNGGGYPVTFVTRNARSPLGAADNYYTFASDFGDVHDVLAWRGLLGERAHEERHHLPGWHQHRTRRPRLLPDVTNALPELFVTAGSVLANAQSAACAVTEPWLTTYPQLAVVHDPEDRSAARRVDQVHAERAALDDQHVRRDQRSLAAGELQRQQRDPAVVEPGASPDARSGVPNG